MSIIITVAQIIKMLLDREISSIFITIIILIINIFSSYVLGHLTKFEKHSSKSKNIFSDISKYYLFNFLLFGFVAVLNFNYIKNDIVIFFTYLGIETYFVENIIIIEYMFWSIITSHASQILLYLYNLLRKFIDSKYNNGKTTEKKDKKSYEKIYVGPEFPFSA